MTESAPAQRRQAQAVFVAIGQDDAARHALAVDGEPIAAAQIEGAKDAGVAANFEMAARDRLEVWRNADLIVRIVAAHPGGLGQQPVLLDAAGRPVEGEIGRVYLQVSGGRRGGAGRRAV